MTRLNKGFILLLVFIVVGLACNLPGSESEDAPVVDAVPVPVEEEPPFIEITVTPHDAGRIIILEVYSDSDKYVTAVVLKLPEHLHQAEIFANDQLIDDVVLDKGNARIDLSGKMKAKTVTFTFKLDGNLEAVCVIDMNDPLQPGGECDY